MSPPMNSGRQERFLIVRQVPSWTGEMWGFANESTCVSHNSSRQKEYAKAAGVKHIIWTVKVVVRSLRYHTASSRCNVATPTEAYRHAQALYS